MTERELTKRIQKKVKGMGASCDKIAAGPHQPIGLPDLVGCYEGLYFGFEVKMPGKEKNLTKRQEKALKKIRAAGGLSAVVTSPRDAARLLTWWKEEYINHLTAMIESIDGDSR